MKRTLVYATVSYRNLPETERNAFIGVADKLIAVCDKLLKKDESLVLPQHSLIGVAGLDFEFRETCGIEELPALMLRERLPLEMVMTMLETSFGEIDLTELDMIWTKEAFTVEWRRSDRVTTPAREKFEEFLKTFGLPGTWTCEWEDGFYISISQNGLLFLINFTEVLEWSDGDLLIPRTKS